MHNNILNVHGIGGALKTFVGLRLKMEARERMNDWR